MKRFIVAFLLALFAIQTPAIGASTNDGPIIFVIDTSGSMKTEKLMAVKTAVKEIVNNLKQSQEVGIISFSEAVLTVLPPSGDLKIANEKIDSLFAGGDTSMYDAVEEALNIESTPKPSQIVLISDGEDTTSNIGLDQLIADATTAGIQINTIGVQVTKAQRNILTAIAEAGAGNFYDVTDISTLIQTYQVILEANLDTATKTISEVPNSTGKILLNRNVYVEVAIATLATIFIFLLFISVYQRVRNRERQIARIKTLQKYSYRKVRKTSNRIKVSITSYSFIPNRVEKAIREKLELIHSDMRYETVIHILMGLWAFLVALFTLALHAFIVALIFASLLLPLIFRAVTNSIRAKQKQKFAEELPELLNILASALRAGLSLPQGLEAFATDSKGEVAREIRRTIGEIRVGTPIDEALMGVAERMESEDLKWAVTALSIQRVVGGSMATILTTTFETVKARAEIRREVKTLSAEGKLSAYVLIALPIGIFSFLFLTRREYVKVFWTDPAGIFLLVVIGIALSIGWAWMKKIVEIKI